MAKRREFEQFEYQDSYVREHYDRIGLKYRKDDFMLKMIERAMVKRRMQSKTEYIKMAIESQLQRDGIDVDAMRENLRRMERE